MTAPQIALNKLGEMRNQDPTLYQVIQELRDKANTALTDTHGTIQSLNGTVQGLALAGDVTGALGKTVVGKIQGQAISTTAPTPGQILTWNGSAWAAAPAPATGVSVLFSQTADSTTTANTASSMLGTGSGSLTLPANFFTVGKGIRLRIGGYVSVADGGNSSKTQVVTLGGTNVILGGNNTPFTSTLGYTFFTELWLVCRTTGSPGSVIGSGYFSMSQPSNTPVYWGTANTVTTAITTTGTLLVGATYNNGNATGTITTVVASLESL
jgi:hypothetical protein